MIARVHRVLNATECMFEMIKGKIVSITKDFGVLTYQ